MGEVERQPVIIHFARNFFRAETERMNRSPTHWRVRQQPGKKKHSLHF